MINRKKRSLIDKKTLKSIMASCGDDEKSTYIINFYLNSLDHSLQSMVTETKEGWAFIPSMITPKIAVTKNNDVMIGVDVHVSFASEFQNAPVLLFCLICWNSFDEKNLTRCIPEARYNLTIDIVPGDHLSRLLLYMRKYATEVEAVVGQMWKQVIHSMQGIVGATEEDDDYIHDEEKTVDTGQTPPPNNMIGNASLPGENGLYSGNGNPVSGNMGHILNAFPRVNGENSFPGGNIPQLGRSVSPINDNLVPDDNFIVKKKPKKSKVETKEEKKTTKKNNSDEEAVFFDDELNQSDSNEEDAFEFEVPKVVFKESNNKKRPPMSEEMLRAR